MKSYIAIIFSIILFASCSRSTDGFSNIKKGMSKDEVLALVGEPSSKNDILVAEIWNYETSDRTVVFRNGEVFRVMTSAEARVDSIENAVKETGRDVGDKLRSAADTIDSAGLLLRQKITGDSAKKN